MSSIKSTSPKPMLPTPTLTTVQNESFQDKNLTGGAEGGKSVAPQFPTQESLISETESSRQATQANPETTKLVSAQKAQGSQSVQDPQKTAFEDPIDKVANTPLTPFEEIPAAQMSKDEAKTELLALQDKGDIKLEFTDEGKTRLFVPMFNVNFKKETEDKSKSKVKSFLFPKPQDAVKLSRLSEWFSFKGIKEVLFRNFSKTKEADKPAEAPPTVENKTPAPTSQVDKPTATQTVESKSSADVSPTQTPAAQTAVKTPVKTKPAAPEGVSQPSSPPPSLTQKTKPETIPLSRLRTGGTIPLSSSATPIQKPTTGIAKPSVPHPTASSKPTLSPMQLVMSQTMAQKNLDNKLNTTSAPKGSAQAPAKTALQTPDTSPLQSLTTSQNKEGLVASETLRTDKTQTPTVTTKKPPSTLSSLGDRLQSLIRKKPTSSRATRYSRLSPRAASLLKSRPKLSLWNMDIAGVKGQDPKTGRVIETHGNRDYIRFTHQSYLQSIRSNRAEVAREANQQAAMEKEQQAQAQRSEEQQQLRMLLDLEQMRQIESNRMVSQTTPPLPVDVAPVIDIDPTQLETGASQVQIDPASAVLQHQWEDGLKKN